MPNGATQHNEAGARSTGTFRRARLRRFLMLAVPTLLVTTIAVGLVAWSRYGSTRQALDARLDKAGELAGSSIERDMVALASDVLILGGDRLLQLALDDVSTLRPELARAFARVAVNTRSFDQIRLVDATGAEIVRVTWSANKGAHVVPIDDLASSADRRFFAATKTLPRGSLYASQLDLDAANGRVTWPPKPVLRLATPVIGSDGKFRGILVASVLGRQLLQRSTTAISDQDATPMLVNDTGYWLSGPHPEREWAFAIRPDSEPDFAAEHPLVWAAMRTSEHGVIETEAGLIAYHHVTPFKGMHADDGGLATDLVVDEHGWWALAYVPAADLRNTTLDVVYPTVALGAAFGLVMLLGLWILSGSQARRAAAEADRARQLQITSVLLETLPAPTWIKGADGRYLDVNPAFARFFGVPREQLLNATVDSIMEGERAAAVEASDRAVLESGLQDVTEFRHRTASGEERDLVAFKAPFTDAQGQASGTVGVLIDVTERKSMEALLRAEATRDGLTGLSNRAHLDAVMKALDLSDAQRPVGVIAVDLDGLKMANDTFGHAVGDEAIKRAGMLLRSAARDADTVARTGGDEFTIILAGGGDRALKRVSERIRRLLKTEIALVETQGGRPFRVDLSLGTAVARRGESIIEAAAAADAAMYQEKVAKPGRADRLPGPSSALLLEPEPEATPTLSIA